MATAEKIIDALRVTDTNVEELREYNSGIPSPRDLPNPGIEHRFPALQADSLPAEPQGKPKNTGVGRGGSSRQNW